jgi:hypothetical protein
MKKGPIIIAIILIMGIIGYYQNKINKYEKKLNNLKYKFDDVVSSSSFLESEINDFEYENWRDNVPEVASAFYDLQSAISDVEYEF